MSRSCSSRASSDAVTAARGIEYLAWFVPALAPQFPLVALGAALPGMGDLKVPAAIQMNLWLLQLEFKRKLTSSVVAAPPQASSAAI